MRGFAAGLCLAETEDPKPPESPFGRFEIGDAHARNVAMIQRFDGPSCDYLRQNGFPRSVEHLGRNAPAATV
jgi:hypothetical protein